MTADLDLNSLLAEAVADQAEARRAADARKRMKQVTGVSAQERAEDAQRILSWESQHVWKPVANVARFVEQQCNKCGDCQYLFSGLLQRQQHRHLKTDGSQRWVKVDSALTNLPNETMLVNQTVPMCMECCEQVGFTLDGAYWEDGTPVEWEGEEVVADAVEPTQIVPVSVISPAERAALLPMLNGLSADDFPEPHFEPEGAGQ